MNRFSRPRKLHELALFAALLPAAAFAQTAHPLEGKIWDSRAQRFLGVPEAVDRAAASRQVLLGEKHDSDEHHRLQLEMLKALAARGVKPALAMEQFDREHQSALSAAQRTSNDPEQLADAGKLNRKGWRWPMYRSLIDFGAAQGWPLVAANLSREEGRAIAMGTAKPVLPPADAQQQARMEAEIVAGHCGMRPPEERLAAIVTAQRARDARMAEAISSQPGPVVLIAGAGHVRRDRAVPRYLPDADKVLAIAYVETVPGREAPQDYDSAGFDLLWFTAPTERADACATPLRGSVAPQPANPIPNTTSKKD